MNDFQHYAGYEKLNVRDEGPEQWAAQVATGQLKGASLVGDAAAQPLTVAVMQRLEMLAKLLDGADSCLASARDRLLGPWPETASGSNSAKIAGPPSRRDELMNLLDHLTGQAQRVVQHAQVLNSGL